MGFIQRMSIKSKITLLSTTLMLLNALVVISIAIILGNAVLQGVSAGELEEIAKRSTSQVFISGESVKFSEDFKFVNNGVYQLVLANDGMVVAGSYPVSSAVEIGVPRDGGRTVNLSSGAYYVVDKPIPSENSDNPYWIRAMETSVFAHNIGHALIRFLLILMPIFVIISAIISYYVAKKSFAPVDDILNAVGNIRQGSDLSSRINLGHGDDEIHRLSKSFDEMFERLEYSFTKERQFTSDASHELRTPTSVILAQCDYLENYSDDYDEYVEGIANIKAQAYTMREIIESMLTLSRLDNNPHSMSEEVFNLSESLNSILDECAFSLTELETVRDIEPNVYVSGNPTLFSHAISNILSNASKYGNNYASVELSSKSDLCLISVRDKGPGIPSDKINSIWNRFYQADASRSESKGYGLGLALVQEVITLHKGRVWADNHPQGGCIFYIELPLSSPRT